MAEDSQSKGMSDFLMKVMSLILAIMVWFIIKTAAGLSYSNAEPSRCLLYTSPSPRDGLLSRMPSSA